jgi:virginiamycin B lyase
MGGIGRVTPAGGLTTYPFSPQGSIPGAITAGLDGALWFTYDDPDRLPGRSGVGRITTTGTIMTFPLPLTGGTMPNHIITGPGGSLWFSERINDGDVIANCTASGAITEFPLPTKTAIYVDALTAGPNGNLWYAENYGFTFHDQGTAFNIGRFNPSTGSMREFTVPGDIIESMIAGPDGNLWYGSIDSVGRFTPP